MCLDYCKTCGVNKVVVNPLCFHCHKCCQCAVTANKNKFLAQVTSPKDHFDFAFNGGHLQPTVKFKYLLRA